MSYFYNVIPLAFVLLLSAFSFSGSVKGSWPPKPHALANSSGIKGTHVLWLNAAYSSLQKALAGKVSNELAHGSDKELLQGCMDRAGNDGRRRAVCIVQAMDTRDRQHQHQQKATLKKNPTENEKMTNFSKIPNRKQKSASSKILLRRGKYAPRNGWWLKRRYKRAYRLTGGNGIVYKRLNKQATFTVNSGKSMESALSSGVGATLHRAKSLGAQLLGLPPPPPLRSAEHMRAALRRLRRLGTYFRWTRDILNGTGASSRPVRVLSPRLFSLVEVGENSELSLGSPTLFSLDDRQPNSLTRLLQRIGSDEPDQWAMMLAQTTGVGDTGAALLQLLDNPATGKSNPLQRSLQLSDVDVAQLRHILRSLDAIGDFQDSFSAVQRGEMDSWGYTVLEGRQVHLLYGRDGVYGDAFAQLQHEHGADFDAMAKAPHHVKHRLLEHAGILQGLRLPPGVLSPEAIGSCVLSPAIFSPKVLGPTAISPSVLCPGLFNPSILSPKTLAPEILSPFLFGPIILGPKALSPRILTPHGFSPAILSPKVLSPSVLSPGLLDGDILSPYALSPSILSKGKHTFKILSPSTD